MTVERKKHHQTSQTSSEIITNPQDIKTLKILKSIIKKTTESGKILKNKEQLRSAMKLNKRHLSGQTFDENQHPAEPKVKEVSKLFRNLEKQQRASTSMKAHNVVDTATRAA